MALAGMICLGAATITTKVVDAMSAIINTMSVGFGIALARGLGLAVPGVGQVPEGH